MSYTIKWNYLYESWTPSNSEANRLRRALVGGLYLEYFLQVGADAYYIEFLGTPNPSTVRRISEVASRNGLQLIKATPADFVGNLDAVYLSREARQGRIYKMVPRT